MDCSESGRAAEDRRVMPMATEHDGYPPVQAGGAEKNRVNHPTHPRKEREVIDAHYTPDEKPKRPALGSKREMVLSVLLSRGQRGLNCFEAVDAAHDFVLRSTVSELCSDFALQIPRTLEYVPGFNRKRLIPCMRYRQIGRAHV